MRSSFDALYRERLSSPSRTYMDIAKYAEVLQQWETIAEDSKRYLADRLPVTEIQKSHPGGFFPPEYNAVKAQMAAYADQLADLKDAKYIAFNKSMLETRISTRVRNLYVLADIGLDEGYVYIFGTFFQGAPGALLHENYGTVDL